MIGERNAAGSAPTAPSVRGTVMPRSGGGAGLGDRGFTLIELLVVLAILAILASLLLPALGNVRQPTRLGGISLSAANLASRVAFMGHYACVTGDGLEVFDLGNPQQPVSVGRHRTDMPTYGLQVVGDLAYVAAGDCGLAIFGLLFLRVVASSRVS